MSRLLFSSDGKYLISMYVEPPTSWSLDKPIIPHQFDYTIDVWDVKKRKKIFPAKGYLIGISKDCKTFITQVSETQFLGWNIGSGQPVPIESLDPNCYAPSQRGYLIERTYGISIRDVFDKDKSVRIIFDDTAINVQLESFLYGVFSTGDGMQGAYGNAYDIHTGQMALKYPISKNAIHVPFFEVEKYAVVFVGDDYKRYLIDPNVADMSSTLKPQDFHNMQMASNIGMILRKQQTKITGIATHPTEDWVAVSLLQKEGALDIWDIKTVEALFTLGN